MRVKVKLVKSVTTMAGTWNTFTGELDREGGVAICWLDEDQNGRRVPPKVGIILPEGASLQVLPPKVVAAPEDKTPEKRPKA